MRAARSRAVEPNRCSDVAPRSFSALAKARPGQINYSSGGTGGLPHLAGELFKITTHVDILHVPYKSSAGAHIDLHLPNGLVRQFSLVVPDSDPDKYVVGVKRDAASRGGSRYIIEEMRVGDQIKISPPRNNSAAMSAGRQT